MATQKYELKGNDIIREGVKIATRDPGTGTVDYLPDMDRYRAPVAGWLAENGLSKPPVAPPEVANRKPVFVGSPAAAPENANTTPPQMQETATAADELSPDKQRIAWLEAQLAALKGGGQHASPIAETGPGKPLAKPVDYPRSIAKEEGTGFIRPSMGDGFMDPQKLRTYPDAPKYDERGDKTPAFVDWLFANHPKDAEHRYFGRKLSGKSYEERIEELRNAGKLV